MGKRRSASASESLCSTSPRTLALSPFAGGRGRRLTRESQSRSPRPAPHSRDAKGPERTFPVADPVRTTEGQERVGVRARSRWMVNGQIRNAGERIEVAVVVIDLCAAFQADGGDETVDTASDRESPPSRRPIQVRCGFERLESAWLQNRVSPQAHACPLIRIIVTNALKDLTVHDVDQRDRGAGPNSPGQMPADGRPPGSGEVVPNLRFTAIPAP